MWEPGWCAYSHVRKRTQAESGKHVESVCPWHVGFPLKEGEGWGSEGGPPVLAAMPPPGSGLLILWLRPRPRRYLRPSAPAHVFAEDSSPAWMAPEPVPPAKMTPADIERERQAFREQHSRAKQQQATAAQEVRHARAGPAQPVDKAAGLLGRWLEAMLLPVGQLRVPQVPCCACAVEVKIDCPARHMPLPLLLLLLRAGAKPQRAPGCV